MAQGFAGKGISMTKKQILLSLVVLLVIISMSMYGATWLITSEQKDDGLIINLAGRQRMLSQKYVMEVFREVSNRQFSNNAENAGRIASEQITAYRQYYANNVRSEKARALFEMTLTALIDGGKTYTDLAMTQEVILPKVESPKLKAKLEGVSDIWTKVIEDVEIVRTNSVDSEAYQHALAGVVEKVTGQSNIMPGEEYDSQAQCSKNSVLLEMDSAVEMMQKQSESKVNKLLNSQNTGVVISCIFGVFACIVIIRITNSLTVEIDERKRVVEETSYMNERLTNTAAEISDLMLGATGKDDLGSRFQNDSLQRCWINKQCTQTTCPAYGRDENLRCWETAGTFCKGEVQGVFAQKLGNCSKCEVFQAARTDTVTELGETFNLMMVAYSNRQADLKAANARFETLLSTIPAFIYFKDAELNYVSANKPLAEMVGTTPEEMVGCSDLDFFSREQAEVYRSDDAKVIKTGKPLVDHEETITDKDGITMWVLTNKRPICDINGQVVGLVGMTLDITERKSNEQKLQESLAEIERFNKLMLGREGRVLEVKKEVNALLAELGREPAYLSVMEKQGHDVKSDA